MIVLSRLDPRTRKLKDWIGAAVFYMAAIIPALNTSPVWAEWVRYSEEPSLGVYYYDPMTIRQDGNLVRVLTLVNYKKERSTSLGEALSSRVLLEIDCKRKGLVRQLAYSDHSEAMAGGKTLVSIDTPDGGITGWEYPTPRSAAAMLFKNVCFR